MTIVKVDLTDGKEITPQLVAEVREATGNGERRQADRRSNPGRRAIDRMSAVRPGEIDRIGRTLGSQQ